MALCLPFSARRKASTYLASEFKPNQEHRWQHDPAPGGERGRQRCCKWKGCAPQFGSSLDPSSFNIAVVLFVGGLAERRQTLGKNDAKNQTIVNVS
jgi:hypothetical protein